MHTFGPYKGGFKKYFSWGKHFQGKRGWSIESFTTKSQKSTNRRSDASTTTSPWTRPPETTSGSRFWTQVRLDWERAHLSLRILGRLIGSGLGTVQSTHQQPLPQLRRSHPLLRPDEREHLRKGTRAGRPPFNRSCPTGSSWSTRSAAKNRLFL